MRATWLVVLVGCFNPDLERGRACKDWCPAPEICVANQCRLDDASLPNFAFVTSDVRVIEEHSVAELDAWCADRARGGGLPGEYRAWVSTSTQDARARIGETGATGWVRPDNEPFANTLEQILSGRHYYPLRIAQDGSDVGPADGEVATATLASGMVATSGACADFPGSPQGALVQIGKADAGTESWTSTAPIPCGALARIYCFGIDRLSTVTPSEPEPGAKRAFITKNPYTLKTPDEADGFCNTEAGVPAGTMRYRSMLATTATSVRDRFEPVGGKVWYRTDGVRLTRGMAELEAPLEVAFDGVTHIKGSVWFGAISLTAKGQLNHNCGDFVGGGGVRTGDSQRSIGAAPFSTNQGACGNQYHFYCAEI